MNNIILRDNQLLEIHYLESNERVLRNIENVAYGKDYLFNLLDAIDNGSSYIENLGDFIEYKLNSKESLESIELNGYKFLIIVRRVTDISVTTAYFIVKDITRNYDFTEVFEDDIEDSNFDSFDYTTL